MAKKIIKSSTQINFPKLKYRYMCPACTNDAIKSSNKMNAKITCQHCGHDIVTSDLDRWQKI